MLTSHCLERDFPGSPVVNTSHSQCRGIGSIPGQRTMSPEGHVAKHTHTQEYVWKNTGKFFLPRLLFSILCLNIHQTLFKVLSYKFSPGICLSQLPWEMLFFPFAIENFKLKEKKYLPKVSQLVSCKDKTQIQVSLTPGSSLCCIILFPNTLAQRMWILL
ncbi:unnamed protein product [Rangifer tarandus platyrhynchus]|uniref:Uncharacterized protein n=2 Tax=Rangifer tarandus platyrhynchus TaxID=3082113 RepID=A0AC59Z5W6_RANTA|nr:unnamed protein product [Rangifer tarandus platyrhynchus]